MGVKGYKVFNPDWTCRGFQYEVGKTFKHDGGIEMCKSGFHFCRKASDCFKYYPFNSENKVAEIEAIGQIETGYDKSVTDEIKIIRELSWHEVLDIINEGRGCTGRGNTGNYNSGDYNTGSWNVGYYNSGSFNTGSWNIGDYNTGNCNTGNWNTGDYNTGNCNTGNWNKANFSFGFFNTNESPIIVFNKPCNISREDLIKSSGMLVLHENYINDWWICSEDMTEEEKKEHPEHEVTGGYLKTVDFKTACAIMWNNMNDDEKQAVREIPNFNADVFMEITGIDVND